MALRIEVWLDINCPYCCLGFKNLEQALFDLALREEVNVVWRHFELDPTLPEHPMETKFEQLARKYRRDLSWAKTFCEALAEQGKAAGIEFDFDTLKVCRSLLAHKALKYAERHGLETAFLTLLYKHNYELGAQLSRWETLAELARQVGFQLPSQHVLEQDQQIQQLLDEDALLAKQLAIRAVPFYRFNRKIVVKGAQPVEVFKQQIMASMKR